MTTTPYSFPSATSRVIGVMLWPMNLLKIWGGVAAIPIKADVAERGYGFPAKSYGSKTGGFGKSAKVPRPVVLSFLFSYSLATTENNARDMALFTPGKITNPPQGSTGCEVTISNMTGTSAKLMIKSCQSIKKCDRLQLEYSDGNTRRKINRKMTVRLVKGKNHLFFHVKKNARVQES